MLINYGYNFTLFLHTGKNRLTIVGNFLFLVFEIQFGFSFIISGLYEPNEEKRGFMAYKVEQYTWRGRKHIVSITWWQPTAIDDETRLRGKNEMKSIAKRNLYTVLYGNWKNTFFFIFLVSKMSNCL